MFKDRCVHTQHMISPNIERYVNVAVLFYLRKNSSKTFTMTVDKHKNPLTGRVSASIYKY